MATPVTGDQKDYVSKEKFGVTLHNFPTVLDTELADATSTINDYAQSGKRLGAQVMAVNAAGDTAAIYCASGNSTTAVWALVAQVLGTGSAAVTPA